MQILHTQQPKGMFFRAAITETHSSLEMVFVAQKAKTERYCEISVVACQDGSENPCTNYGVTMSEALHTLNLNYACRRHMVRAQEAFPTLSVLDGLAANAEKERGGLTKNSVRVYIHEHRVIARHLLANGEITDGEAQPWLGRIVAAITARHDGALAPRTSAKKSKSLTAPELAKVFAGLKRLALADDEIWVAVVAMMVLAASTLGARPVEMTTIEHSGNYLRLQTAKRSARASKFRLFDAHRMPAIWIEAMAFLTKTLGQEKNVDSFYRRLRCLSQILGRVSQACIGRRICFYTLRHVSIATWKRARISAQDVAQLAGHISVRTAQHYAPARSGHVGPILVAPVALACVPEGLFLYDATSPLMRPPRGARRRDWSTTMSSGEPALLGAVKQESVDFVAGNALNQSREVPLLHAPHGSNTGPANGQSQDQEEDGTTHQSSEVQIGNRPGTAAPVRQSVQRGWINKRLRIHRAVEQALTTPPANTTGTPKTLPTAFEVPDMPRPSVRPVPRQSTPYAFRASPSPTPEEIALDDLIEHYSKPGSGDLKLPKHLDMPRPFHEDKDKDEHENKPRASLAAPREPNPRADVDEPEPRDASQDLRPQRPA